MPVLPYPNLVLAALILAGIYMLTMRLLSWRQPSEEYLRDTGDYDDTPPWATDEPDLICIWCGARVDSLFDTGYPDEPGCQDCADGLQRLRVSLPDRHIHDCEGCGRALLPADRPLCPVCRDFGLEPAR